MDPFYRVKIDPELKELVPSYLERICSQNLVLEEASKCGNFSFIESYAHKLKGIASSYGFPYLSELGQELEVKSQMKMEQEVRDIVLKLIDYVTKVVVTYE